MCRKGVHPYKDVTPPVYLSMGETFDTEIEVLKINIFYCHATKTKIACQSWCVGYKFISVRPILLWEKRHCFPLFPTYYFDISLCWKIKIGRFLGISSLGVKGLPLPHPEAPAGAELTWKTCFVKKSLQATPPGPWGRKSIATSSGLKTCSLSWEHQVPAPVFHSPWEPAGGHGDTESGWISVRKGL